MTNVDHEYYRIEKITVLKNPNRLVSAAFHHCALCGGVISSMGGPGDGSICLSCGELLKLGKLSKAVIYD